MRVALYARVSTHEQDEALQLPRLRSYCERMKWEIAGEYTDEASGRDGNRPGWLTLMSDARREEFDAVLVTKLDRVMRSLVQLLEVLQDFQLRYITLITLDQGEIRPDSANARLQIQMIAMVAEWEREIIRERTREALAAKKAAGVVLGRPPAKLPIHTIALMRVAGRTWGYIATELDLSLSTIKNHRREILREIEKINEVVG